MIQGELYPELKRMQMEPCQMQVYHQRVPDWTRPNAFAEWARDDQDISTVPAVRITMPREDYECMLSIYTAHYHAVSQNPAVADAWHQYKMCCALTR